MLVYFATLFALAAIAFLCGAYITTAVLVGLALLPALNWALAQ